MRTLGQTKNCAGCRYWSEMVARSMGGGPVEALCLADNGALAGKYTRSRATCESWKSGHFGAVDEPPDYGEEVRAMYAREEGKRVPRKKKRAVDIPRPTIIKGRDCYQCGTELVWSSDNPKKATCPSTTCYAGDQYPERQGWYIVSYHEGPLHGGHHVYFFNEYPKMSYPDGGPFNSVQGPFYAREECFSEKGMGGEVNCKECGHLIKFSYMEPVKTQLRERQLCFDCNHWTDQIVRAGKDPNVYVIGGFLYSGKHGEKGQGFGGREFKIITNDGRFIHTWNLWGGGDVPQRFRERIPNTARFADEKEWVDVGGMRVLADVR